MIMSFEGIDVDLEISLFEYKVIASKELHEDGSGTHFCIYKITDDAFGCGHISDRDLDELIVGESWMNESDIKSFLESNGCTKDEFLTFPFIQKLHALLNKYGYLNIFGQDYDPMSKGYVIQNYLTPEKKTYYYNTGVKKSSFNSTFLGDKFINDELHISFDCEEVPEGAKLDFLASKDTIYLGQLKYIVREIYNTRLVVKYAYFKPAIHEK